MSQKKINRHLAFIELKNRQKAKEIYSNFVQTRDYHELAVDIVKTFTLNIENVEVVEFIKRVELYFKNMFVPFRSISLPHPSDYLQNSLKCFDGVYQFKKHCVYCTKYRFCAKRNRFVIISRMIYNKLKQQATIQTKTKTCEVKSK